MFKQYILVIILFFLGATTIFAQEKVHFTPEEQIWIEEHPIIHFGYDPNWPPFEMYSNGEYSGILADYISLIENRTGIKMEPVKINSFKETIEKLHSGEIHVAPEVGKNSEREKFLSYTEPYLTDPQVIVTRIDAGFISGLSDLSHKIVSQPEGYVRIKKLKKRFPKIKIITTKDVEESLNLVSRGKAYAFVGSLSVVSYYINNSGYTDLKIASSVELGDINFRLAVTKDWGVFKDISEKVFKSISKEDHRAIRNKWIAVKYDHGIDIRKVWNYVVFALLAFVLLILLFFYWSNKLQKEIKYRKKVEKKLRETVHIVNKKNKEKDTLLKEVHHRVKNNLQMIQSLFNMQSRQVDNDYTRQILAKGKVRIQAISLVHQLLYQSENFNSINIQDYITTLKTTIESIYKKDTIAIVTTVKANDINLNIDDAIPLGLILNELIINSYKYAFVDRSEGHICITISKEITGYRFEYTDNGVGVELDKLKQSDSLGMRLIIRLSNQLGATPEFKNKNGLHVNFTFLGKK